MSAPPVATVTADRRGGTFTVHAMVVGARRLEVKGGQYPYEPREVWLEYRTEDGHSWEFERAHVAGPAIDRRGRPYAFDCGQTYWLGDLYQVPEWLPAAVEAHHPGRSEKP